MSPAPPGVAAQLRQLIHYHLDNGMFENALFLAGRLHGLDPRSPDAAHLVALCNLRLGRYKAAYDFARTHGASGKHLGCAYVFAQASLGLERHLDGVQALEKARGLWLGRNNFSESGPEALGLSHRFSDSDSSDYGEDKHSENTKRSLPDAPACYALLGKLWKAHGDSKLANDNYIEALKLNPFIWDAFTDMCDMGTLVRPVNVFKVTPEMLAALSHSSGANGNGAHAYAAQGSFEGKNPFISTPDIDPFNPPSRTGGDVGLNLGGSNLMSKLNGSVPQTNGHGAAHSDMDTPISNGQNVPEEDLMMGDGGGPVMNEPGIDAPHAPSRKPRLQPFVSAEEPPKMRSITSRSRMKMQSETDATDIPRPVGQNGHKRTVSGHTTQRAAPSAEQAAEGPAPRRSTRIMNTLSQIRPSSSRLGTTAGRDAEGKERRDLRKPAKATGTKGTNAKMSTVGRVVSGNRKMLSENPEVERKVESRPTSATAIYAQPPPKFQPSVTAGQDLEALKWLLDLLLALGKGYAQLSRFQCQEALQTFASIPVAQRETPWVLAQMGKAFYERGMHADAEKVFQRIRDKSPSAIDDMHVFSNVLWQLKNETGLAYLAHTLMDQDRLSPQAWCALGNAYSLEREHDEAIKCFGRATQLDPKFAYGYTLQGHEHLANEETDKALAAYRAAVGADNMHYNGWWGLGRAFEKLQKYEVAEQHYRAAAKINPTNAQLAVNIGTVLDRMNKSQPALMQYTHACELDPRSTLARFRLSQMLLKIGTAQQALESLLQLKDAIPDDANVHFMLGKGYKRVQDRSNAIRHFTIALNLDPKASSYIKEAMENLDEDDDEFGWSSDDDR